VIVQRRPALERVWLGHLFVGTQRADELPALMAERRHDLWQAADAQLAE
jgi:hypothetical protein